MEKLLELNKEELEILITDCQTEIAECESKLISIVIEKHSLRRKIRNLEEEKDLLELVKSGTDFNEYLVSPKPATMNTMQRRYLKIIQNEFRDLNPKEEL